MKKKKRGFTLIEILAAITILGILSVVAIVSVNKVIQNAKVKHYTTAEEQMKLAGQSYVQQNRSKLPKAIGQMVEIKLNTLVKGNYIDEIKDYNKNECDLDKSTVKVFKYSQTDYSYSVYLECPAYKTTDNGQKGGPNLKKTVVEGGDMATSQQLHFIAEDSEKLISYSYIISKGGKELYNSGSVMLKDYPKKYDKKFPLREFVPGELKITVTATNIYGVTATYTLPKAQTSFSDEGGPECVYLNAADKVDKPWTNIGPIKITIGCTDGAGTGCTRSEYSKTFKESTRYGEIVIEDRAGHVKACPVSVFYDITSPTIKVVAYNLTEGGTKGSKVGEMTADNNNRNQTLDLSDSFKKWYNKSTSPYGIMLEVTYSDGESPVTFTAVQNGDGLSTTEASAGFTSNTGFTTVESGTTAGNSQTKQYKITKDGYKIFKIVGRDEIGNQTAINVFVPLDRVAPTKPVVTNANEDKWATANYNISATSKDELSGVESIQFTRKNDATTVTTNETTGFVKMPSSSALKNADATGTHTINTDGNYTGKVRACDAAGNCSEVATTKIKLDKVKPTTPIITVSGKSPMTVNMTSSDATSGIAYFERRTLGSTGGFTKFTETGKNSITVTTSENLEIRAVDNAGNVSDLAYTKNCNTSGGELKYDNSKGWICVKDKVDEEYDDCTTTNPKGPPNDWYCKDEPPGYCWAGTGWYYTTTKCTTKTRKACPSGFKAYTDNGKARCYKNAD